MICLRNVNENGIAGIEPAMPFFIMKPDRGGRYPIYKAEGVRYNFR